MRKLIVSMNVTLNGCMAGPNAELDWHFKSWNEEMARVAAEQLSRADTILLGRVTYAAMAGYWPFKDADVNACREDLGFADMMNRYTKIVFSRTLSSVSGWNNSVLLKGNIAREITQLKRKEGKALMVYGSGSMVNSLIRLKLIDEYLLWIHPVVIQKGEPFFKLPAGNFDLSLNHTRTFDSGVALLSYKAALLNR